MNLYLTLCHSAFVRVATTSGASHVVAEAFATAHSCGLRLTAKVETPETPELCHSAFVRVATARYYRHQRLRILCHSAFVRVATEPLR